ncbi:MAG: phosphotransferase [Roseiflexaceae bacterium]|nr:phosphotransferase [Roseiflexaceae bacterium]
MDVAEIVAGINAAHDTTYTLGPRFAGGYQDGAYPLVDIHGQQYVLKLSYAPRAIPLIQQLHACGYPTPGVIYIGQLAGHTPYLVQEFLSGAPLAALTLALAEQLVRLIDQQADRNPTPQADWQHSWSRYAHAVVFANESDWTARIRRATPATVQLLDGIAQLVAPFQSLVLPNTDIVHGDFSIENVLADHGRITGIIDMCYAGYGTRAIDLATLLHFAYVHDSGELVRQGLQQQIRQLVDHAGLCVCLAYRIIAMLAWAIECDHQAIDRYVHHGWQIVRDLSD